VLSKDDPASVAIIAYGEYRQREIDALCARLRAGDTAICVAPGIGLHLIAIAQAVGPSGHVIAYESRPVHRRILVQNLSSRGITNVTVMRRNLGPPTADDPSQFDTVDVLNLQRLALLKIDDIESAASVIAGAEQTLWRTRPGLCVAANTEADIELIGSLVSRFGYRSWRIEMPSFNLANFARRPDDVFGNRVDVGLIALPEEHAAALHGDGFAEVASYVGR
jgi:hypothetical protein